MIFIDANIFMYAAGKSSKQRRSCQEFLRHVCTAKPGTYFTNTEVLQEILHRYRSLNLPEVGVEIFDSLIKLDIKVLPVELKSMLNARILIEQYTKLSTRDAVHAGVMQEHQVESIVTYNKGFNYVPWIEVLDPLDLNS
ncbi:MAG: type II toxin-antitoxin system VapC family toxin [Bdellovibrionales bacterium]|nr:type II toxin-antitoxin system VapC family toxin [Bdellovibrionales bacterium]